MARVLVNLYFKILNTMTRKLQFYLRASTMGVRILVVNQKQEILLVKHTYAPGWHFPGGGVDRRETVLAAAIREVYEEAGIVPTEPPELFGIYYHQVRQVDDFPVLYVVKAFKQVEVNSSEIAETQWVSFHSLPEGTTSATRRRVQEYFSRVEIDQRW